MNLLAANALSIVSVIVCAAMAYTGHTGFAVALLVLAFLCSHGVKDKDE